MSDRKKVMTRCPEFEEETCPMCCKHRGLHEERYRCGHIASSCPNADGLIQYDISKDCE